MHFAQDQYNWDQEYGRNKEAAVYNSNHYLLLYKHFGKGGGKLVEQAVDTHEDLPTAWACNTDSSWL